MRRLPARRTALCIGTVTFALLIVSAPVAVRADQAFAAVPPPDVEAAFTRGASLWAQSGCAGCHVGTEDAAPVVELSGLSSKYSPTSLAEYLRSPRLPMPPFPFTGTDRDALALYLLQTRP